MSKRQLGREPTVHSDLRLESILKPKHENLLIQDTEEIGVLIRPCHAEEGQLKAIYFHGRPAKHELQPMLSDTSLRVSCIRTHVHL